MTKRWTALLMAAGTLTLWSPTAAIPKNNEDFANGRAQFREVRRLLSEGYYTELDEDALYRAAVRGMLEYADPQMGQWNALLTPAELAALKTDLSGSIVGVGIAIGVDENSGLATVRATLPDSPARKAGVTDGDILVRVDDTVVQGVPLADLVARIRGEAGTSVSLTLLRGGELVTLPVERETVKLAAVTSDVLDGDVGYLRIHSFHERTEAATRDALEALAGANVRALIVDLRHNPGGALQPALDTADLLLPAGSPIITTRKRERGHLVENRSIAKSDAILAKIPVAVLVDEGTSSSAELTAVALRTAGATLVGETTRGKWSAQWLTELDNGYGVKFTTSLIEGADGETYNGTGVQPDVEVATASKSLPVTGVASLADDAALRTAHTLLQRARH